MRRPPRSPAPARPRGESPARPRLPPWSPRERDAQGVPDAVQQKRADRGGALDDSAEPAARFGHAEVKGVVAARAQVAVSGDGQRHVGRLDREHDIRDAAFFKGPRFRERALRQRLRRPAAVALVKRPRDAAVFAPTRTGI